MSEARQVETKPFSVFLHLADRRALAVGDDDKAAAHAQSVCQGRCRAWSGSCWLSAVARRPIIDRMRNLVGFVFEILANMDLCLAVGDQRVRVFFGNPGGVVTMNSVTLFSAIALPRYHRGWQIDAPSVRSRHVAAVCI